MNIVVLIYHPSALTNWVAKLSPYMKWCNLTVLHIAKLHGIKPVAIEGVSLYDVSGYRYKEANRLVKSLKPDLFIFLSFRSILELTYQRICVNRKIHKVYLEHGLFSNDTLKFKPNKLKNEFWPTFKRQFSFARTHFGLLIQRRHFFSEMKLFYQVYLKKRFDLVPYDNYFLFSRRSFDNYSRVFQMREHENVIYMGYPIFDNDSQKGTVSMNSNGGILYVHQPLISDGLAKISFEEEKVWLCRIEKLLSPKYGKMTILLHPRANLEEYKKRFSDTEISVVKAPNNFRLFADKKLIIGHYSTALLYGLYFEKPTIVLDYPTMQNDPLFAELFTYVGKIEDLPAAEVHVDVKKKEYMVGDYNTFEHIAQAIEKYLTKINIQDGGYCVHKM